MGANFITDETEALASFFGERSLAATGDAAPATRRFNGLKLKEDSARKFKLLQLALMLSDPKDRAEYATKLAYLQGAYGKAKYCPPDAKDKCLALGEPEKVLANSGDPAKLKEAWVGWHSQSPSYKQSYVDFHRLLLGGI